VNSRCDLILNFTAATPVSKHLKIKSLAAWTNSCGVFREAFGNYILNRRCP